MNQKYERENAHIFAECAKTCQNCKFCRREYALSTQHLTKDKTTEYSNEKNGSSMCLVEASLLEFVKYNDELSDTQFLRVKFYHDMVDFLGEVCGGTVAARLCNRLDEAWSRTMLNVYRAVHNVGKLLSTTVDGYALARTKAYGLNDMMQNTQNQATMMLKMIERQGALGELAKRLDNAVSWLGPESLDIAKMRFFAHKTARETAKNLQICSRTVQRRTDKLVHEFYDNCLDAGIDFDWVLEEVGRREPWLLEWFKF